jgi:organic radical activating enzyme
MSDGAHEEHNLDVHSVDSYWNFLKEKREEINKVSPTFCGAKWKQSTILLYSGETHSCHHPSRHKITLEDIKDNPRGIHNTAVKRAARKEMLEGIQTKECDYCWKIENLNKDWMSDRIYKSTYSWALPHIEDIVKSGDGADIDPSYLEVAFESTCNFKCVYCSPESSSRWQEEIETHGPIELEDFNLHDLDWLKEVGKLPIHRKEQNPYIDAFWEWWPDLYPNLHTFRITGGEPLLSKHTWRVLDYIAENPNPNLTLAINSNLNVPDKLVEKLVEYINRISGNIKLFDVYTSLESTGKHAEYSRFGMEFDEFKKNCKYVLDNTSSKTRLHYMTTINLTSAPTFLEYLEYIREMRLKYYSKLHEFRVRTHLSYLRWPRMLCLTLLSEEDKQKFGDLWINYVEQHKLTPNKSDQETFYLEEVDQVRRLVDYMRTTKEPESLYKDFRNYTRSLDKRRKTSFVETFPELAYMMEDDYYG